MVLCSSRCIQSNIRVVAINPFRESKAETASSAGLRDSFVWTPRERDRNRKVDANTQHVWMSGGIGIGHISEHISLHCDGDGVCVCVHMIIAIYDQKPNG